MENESENKIGLDQEGCSCRFMFTPGGERRSLQCFLFCNSDLAVSPYDVSLFNSQKRESNHA